MSEFLGEARVVIRPDTTRFRAELQAQVLVAARGVTVPVSVVPTVAGSTAGLVAGQLAAQTALNRANVESSGITRAKSEADKEAAKSAADHAKQLGAVRTAAFASAAGMTGLRGAVLTAGGAFLAATVGIQAFSKAVGSAAELEVELNVFRVTAGATADEMERVAETAKALGRDLTLPGVTATEAAQTFLQLARAGLSVQESLDGARGVLQLAVAAEISFADAAQIAASALNAFALEGEEAVNVADLLTNAANASQASIGDMGIALRQSAAIADLAGFSLSETVTFLTQLARAGLAGLDAGTSFRVAIQRLIAPTEKARGELERLNVNLRDAQGNLRPEAFFEVGEALERMGRAQGDATRQIIFGNDASRAAAFFARINAQAFREQEDSLKKSGAAAEVAGARNAGFAGSVENLKNQISAFGIELGEISLPVLGAGADAAASSFGLLADTIANNRKFLSDMAESLDEDIAKLEQFADSAGAGEDDLRSFFGNVAQGAGVFKSFSDSVDDSVRSFLGIGSSASQAEPPIKRLATTEQQLGRDVNAASDAVDEQRRSLADLAVGAAAAAAAVARLQGQEKGLEEQVTRARIAGDEQAEISALQAQRAALEEELRKQEAIIARPGVAGEATAREAIRSRILPQLEAVNNEISNIIQEQATENERLASDAARAATERDRNLLDALSGRRDDAERRASIAAETEGIGDDIRAQNAIQALIKQQIQKVRDRIRDERTRREAIRELRLQLQASRREEDALRAQQREDAAARRADAAAAREEGLSLDITFAETTENVGREIAARNRLIALLKEQQAAVKKGTNEWKRLRNAIAEQQQAIKEAREQDEEAKDEGRGFAGQAFDFLQTQQGFAANLLGNLIPSGQTTGLVGGEQPANISATISAQAQVQNRGPTFGQAATEVDILKEMLRVLRAIQGGRAHPEAGFERMQQSAVMDGVGGGGGGGQAVM